ncbi:MAG: DUF3095 domain-containing protein [Candidatus Marinarcus sp.]|uniref:DUF3095 domain-containing protein n=1 Tax=Candidatus Marinarcus sp. TaxID=3100987 RepID=UPI003B009C11
MSKSSRFYNSLKVLKHFSEITDLTHYKSVPPDWYVLVADIKNSTKAIEEGRYKEVNFIGAMVIVSILNLSRQLDIPFIFGGDGATLLIPAVLYEKSCATLYKLRKMVQEQHNLQLRIGAIKVEKIYKSGKKIELTKFEVSKDYIQAVIVGGGIEYCEYLLKNCYEEYAINGSLVYKKIDVDFSGLECRWESVASPKDENLTLLIKVTEEKNHAEYRTILDNIEKIIGDSNERNPIKVENLNLSFSTKELMGEAMLSSNSFIETFFNVLKIMVLNSVGLLLMKFKIKKWGSYKEHITQTTDTEKFDDMLRMVVAVNKNESKQLEAYLENAFKEGKIIYGIHKSDAALMTCLIFERHGKHVHFIDGANGGYALASKNLKARAK